MTKGEGVRGSSAKKGGSSWKLPEPKMIIAASALAVLAIAFVWGMDAKPCCQGGDNASGNALLPENGDNGTGDATATAPVSAASGAEKVEVYHFHRTQQCASCIRLGELAEKTVNTHFADELAAGKLIFGHVNYELPENAALSDRFGPSGASLWIGTTSSGGFSKEEDTLVWYKLQDEAGFISYLKGVIERRLAGELS